MAPLHQSPEAAPPSTRTPAKVPDDCLVYAIGDIHGRADLLRRLHRQILDDAAKIEISRKVIVYLGDYVDRGPDSREILDTLIDDPPDGFEVHHLKGNHEDMLLRFLKTGDNGQMWLMNGGRDTLDSYGIDLSTFSLFRDDMDGLFQALNDAMPDNHRAFLNGLSLHHQEGDYLFVHAGIRPGVALEDQNPHDLTWIRNDFIDSEADFGAVVVHGHTIRRLPDIKDNRIGIDTGAYSSNRLTALVLETDTRRFLQT